MPSRGLTDSPAFERLDADECWRLLGSRAHGRICLSVDDRVRVVLTAYVVQGGVVYARATAFGAFARLAGSRPVTLQVDDMSEHEQAGWSVTVTGRSHRVDDAATLAALWSPVRPSAWGTGTERLWVALTPDDVQGQRLRTRHHGPAQVSPPPASP